MSWITDDKKVCDSWKVDDKKERNNMILYVAVFIAAFMMFKGGA